MNQEIFFSIILPTYNRERKVLKAINSVISQTFESWELIVVDNNSNDQTKKKIYSLKNKKILFYQINNNGVIALSRNYGISKSTGKYLCFLDSDDWWTTNKLEITKQYIDQGYKFLYHDMYLSKNDNFIRTKTKYCRNLSKPIFNDLVNNGPAFPTSSVTVKKELFNSVNNFVELKDLIAWEDYDAWIRISKVNENFIKIPKTLGFLKIDRDNLLNTDKSIDNIFSFKKKYIYEKKVPNWCNFSLLRLYVLKKDFKSAKKYIEKVNFFKLSLILKIKFIIFKLLVTFKN